MDPASVSEVQASRLNAFETRRKRPPTGASSLVRDEKLADGLGFELTIRLCPEQQHSRVSCPDPRILMRFEKDRNSVFPKGNDVDTKAKTGAYSSSFSYKVKAVIVDCVRPFIE